MTRSSAVRATDIEANDLGDDKPTSSRASTSPPFDDTNTRDDDEEEEEDILDAAAGWYWYVGYRYLRGDDSRDFRPRSRHYFPSHLSPANERETERKKMI
eukprot:scaffold12887_cov65-Attheya_sp.AAC.3